MPQDSDEIDRGACLLHQKLQLLNICIRKKAMAASDPCIDRACEEYDLAVIRESEVFTLKPPGYKITGIEMYTCIRVIAFNGADQPVCHGVIFQQEPRSLANTWPAQSKFRVPANPSGPPTTFNAGNSALRTMNLAPSAIPDSKR
jgi:hypothetical protein